MTFLITRIQRLKNNTLEFNSNRVNKGKLVDMEGR